MESNDRGELLACVGSHGTIFPLPRERVHRDAVHHLVVRVLTFNRRGRFLVQRRSLTKESCPGAYTDSASGHVSFRLQLLFNRAEVLREEAIRELGEEVGLSVIDREGPLIKPFHRPVYSPDACETSHCFVAAVQGKLRASDEVDPSKTGFVGRQRLESMLGREEFVPVARELWLALLQHLGKQEPMEAFFPLRKEAGMD